MKKLIQNIKLKRELRLKRKIMLTLWNNPNYEGSIIHDTDLIFLYLTGKLKVDSPNTLKARQ